MLIQNHLKQGYALLSLFLHFGLKHAIRKVQVRPDGTEFEWDASAACLC
jgi:hypothetical protein